MQKPHIVKWDLTLPEPYCLSTLIAILQLMQSVILVSDSYYVDIDPLCPIRGLCSEMPLLDFA